MLQSALNEADNHADENVEKFGPRPILTSPDDVRSTHVLILGDSGSHIYNAHIKSPRNIQAFLRGTTPAPEAQCQIDYKAVPQTWSNLTAVSICGSGWPDWIIGLKTAYEDFDKAGLIETDYDGKRRVPHTFKLSVLII